MPRPLRYAALAAAAGGIVIAGGTVGTNATDTVLRFDPTTRKVKRIGRLPAPVTHAAAVAIGDKAVVIGGRGSDVDSQRATVLAVNPVTGRVRRAGHLPMPLSDVSAVASGSRVLMLGGRDAQGHVRDEIWSARAVGAPADTASAAARDIYAADRPGHVAAAARHARAYVYVPTRPVGERPLQRRGLRHLDPHGATAAANPGRAGAAWSVRLAAARPLLDRPHRDPALSRSA